MRTFIAIELPEDVKAKIFHAFEKLKESNLVRGKFVEKDNLHLTLKFIGEVPIEKLNEIEKTLENLASKFKNFSCSTGKTGVFPNENHVNSVHIELVSDDDKLNELQKVIEESLVKLGIKKDEKNDESFKSHITALRVYVVKNKELFSKKLNNLHIKEIEFDIKNFSLIKSELTPQGPIYRTIKKFNLK